MAHRGVFKAPQEHREERIIGVWGGFRGGSKEEVAFQQAPGVHPEGKEGDTELQGPASAETWRYEALGQQGPVWLEAGLAGGSWQADGCGRRARDEVMVQPSEAHLAAW